MPPGKVSGKKCRQDFRCFFSQILTKLSRATTLTKKSIRIGATSDRLLSFSEVSRATLSPGKTWSLVLLFLVVFVPLSSSKYFDLDGASKEETQTDTVRRCSRVASKEETHDPKTTVRRCSRVDSPYTTSVAIKRCCPHLHLVQVMATRLVYHPRHPDNLPITSIDLQFCIHTALRSAYKLIMQATYKSRSSLNELHLAILLTTSFAYPAEIFTLPDEIFSSANLHTLSLKLISGYSLSFSSNPSIHCTNLRVLKLVDVHITQYVLHKLLSTCKLLQKIRIELLVEFSIIKVNNLRYLDELIIYNLNENDNIFEVDDVPSLRSLYYDTVPRLVFRPVLFKLGTIRSLRELTLDSVSMDDAFSNNQIKVHVYAPNLLVYSHSSTVALPPSLLFSTIPPQQIELALTLDDSIDELFFLNMREVLELSSKFNVTIISNFGVQLPFDIDYVRTILPFPATSVEELVLKQFDNNLWENSLLFDAVFSVCRPMYVKANNKLNLKVANYSLNQLMVQENEIGEVVYCEIRNPLNGRWVALTSSSLSLLDTTTFRDCTHPLTEFKLSSCSP
ncbi:hypothetical protein Tco_0879031 [Tanacetum coccineum]